MTVKVGVSNRHVHLTEETYKKLFGDETFSKRNDLVQPGEFASDKVVSIVTEKSRIDNVRVLGPFRQYNQVEINRTDSYKLGVNPPICKSGNLSKALAIVIEYNGKRLLLDNALIIPNRHIHISTSEANNLGIKDNDETSILIDTDKGGILTNVFYKVSNTAVLELHLDTDDANAMNIKTNDNVEILR